MAKPTEPDSDRHGAAGPSRAASESIARPPAAQSPHLRLGWPVTVGSESLSTRIMKLERARERPSHAGPGMTRP